MFTRATRRTTAALAAICMLAMTAGASAAATTPTPQDYFFDERGLTAHASWQSCQEPDPSGVTHCVSINVFAFDGRQHNRDAELGHANTAFSYLCVTRFEEAFTADGWAEAPFSEGGCVDDPDMVVDDLDLVEISAALDLVEERCVVVDPETGETICEPGSTRTVDVDLVFTGVGEVMSDRWTSTGTTVVDGVRCHTRFASAGTGREALATIQIGEEDPGPSAFAFMVDGRTRSAQNCAG